jgi:predicted HTH domain antitoxin
MQGGMPVGRLVAAADMAACAAQPQMHPFRPALQAFLAAERARRHVADLLSRENDTPLPNHATVEEAIGLYLLNACSLGRAAELAGMTRWDIQDRLKELGISIPVAGNQSAQEIDELAEQLEREGVL